MEIELGKGYESGRGNQQADSIFQHVLPNAVVAKSNELFAQARKSSLWTLSFGLACCAIEMMSTHMSHHDLDRFGVITWPSPRQADVMMENFAPGAIERMGLSYDVVKDINPGIIYAQVKGFGEGSPFEKNLSFDMIAQACGGTFSVTGEMDGPPIRPGVTVGDTGTGMLMAITILGALYKRRESGEGHRLQVAMQDAMLHYMRVNFATQGRTGKAALRGGSKVPGITNAPMGLYPCAPGGLNHYVYIMTRRATPEHWDRLLTLIGREDLIGDERYLTPADRVKNMPEVDDLIATWTSNQTKYDAMRIIGEAGIPAGAVLDTDELNNDVTFEERGVMQTMIHPVHDPFKMPGWPVRVDGKASRLQASPMIGEHTDQVISDWLGINGEAVTALKAEAAVA